jgi:tRNA 2-thiouridine synthesizing protein A
MPNMAKPYLTHTASSRFSPSHLRCGRQAGIIAKICNGANAMNWDAAVDCEGLLCPLPVLRARKRLVGMRAGQVLHVTATDPMAAIDMPHFCNEAGHTILATTQTGTVTTYLIQRGPDDLP